MNPLNKNLIRKFFNDYIYLDKYHCAEVRCFQAKSDFTSKKISRSDKETTIGGWFTDADELVCELARIENVSAHITFNPLSISNRPLTAKNTLRILKHGEFCTDQDISIWRYCIIDIDPAKRGGAARKQNSTEQELLNCISVRNTIVSDLNLQSHCLQGISGNGAFILIRLPDYKNDEESAKLIYESVEFISRKYSNEFCDVDANTKNPSRLVAIPGTWKYRDILSTKDRPHRQVEVILDSDTDNACPFRSSPMAGQSTP